MDFSSVPSSDSGPLFGMDQYWKTNTSGVKLNASGTSLLDPIAPALPTSIHSISNTVDSPLHPALPTSAPPTSTTTDGFILVNSTGLALVAATNKLHVTDGMEGTEGGDNSKKHKSYEEQNAHSILPEGSHCTCKGCHIEGAENENVTGPKKQSMNANKKGKGSKGKK